MCVCVSYVRSTRIVHDQDYISSARSCMYKMRAVVLRTNPHCQLSSSLRSLAPFLALLAFLPFLPFL